MDYKIFKARAKEKLADNRKIFSLAALIYVVFNFIVNLPSRADLIVFSVAESFDLPDFILKLAAFDSNEIFSMIISPIAYIITFAYTFGFYYMALKTVKSEALKPSDIFVGLKSFGKILWLSILEFVYTFPWLILCIVPGFIKMYSYALSFYILADKPELSAKEALKESEKLMKGFRWELFELEISFIGWFLLSLFTLDVSYIYSAPYMFTAKAEFYMSLKNKEYGDATPYGEDEEMYLNSSEDYITYQSASENEILEEISEDEIDI